MVKSDHTLPCLAVWVSPKSSYLLPYYHFLGGELECLPEGKTHDVLILEFVLYTVHIKGTGLDEVFQAVQTHKARTLAPSASELPATMKIIEISAVYRHPTKSP